MVSSFSAFASFGFPETYGVSIRSMALGQAFTAIADDYSATYHNPAGLAQKDETNVSFGLIQPLHSLKVTFSDTGEDVKFYDNRGMVMIDPAKGSDGDNLDVRFPVFGLEVNINRLLRPRINIPINLQGGIFVGLPKNFNILFTIANTAPDSPAFTAFGDAIEHFASALALAIELKKDLLYLGMGNLIGAELKSPRSLMVHSGIMGGSIGNNDEYFEYYVLEADEPVYGVLGYTFGLLFTPFDKKLKIGFSYKEEIITVDADFTPILVYVDPGLGINKIDVLTDLLVGYTPEQICLGVAYSFDRFTVSVDFKTKKWSGFPYDDTTYILYHLDAQGVVQTNPGYEEPGSPDFDDVTDIGVGVEYRYRKNLTLMAGFEYRPTPVPDQSYRITNYLDMDKNVFSIGANLKLNNWCKMGLLFQYMMLDDFKVRKTGLEIGYTWGWDPEVPQKDYEVEGDAFVLGVSFEFKL